jgi:hypothetical protein
MHTASWVGEREEISAPPALAVLRRLPQNVPFLLPQKLLLSKGERDILVNTRVAKLQGLGLWLERPRGMNEEGKAITRLVGGSLRQ